MSYEISVATMDVYIFYIDAEDTPYKGYIRVVDSLDMSIYLRKLCDCELFVKVSIIYVNHFVDYIELCHC